MRRDRSQLIWGTLAAALSIGACRGGGDVRVEPDGGVLACDAPVTALLEPSTTPPNTGLPVAGIAWTEGRCALLTDETHPDVVLVIFDTTGTWLAAGLVAVRGDGWLIADSSEAPGPTTYLTALPTSTDITIELEREDTRLVIVFRIVGRTLTLLSMQRV